MTFLVPGRVCLMGDKIDLKGLPIIAATVDRTLRLDIRKSASTKVSLWSENFKSGVEFDLGRVADRSGEWWTHPLKYVRVRAPLRGKKSVQSFFFRKFPAPAP
jgi:galactokinase